MAFTPHCNTNTPRAGLLDAAVEALSEEAWQLSRRPKEQPDEEIIIIIDILSHPVNQGYDLARLPSVTMLNDVKLRSVRHLKEEWDKVWLHWVESVLIVCS